MKYKIIITFYRSDNDIYHLSSQLNHLNYVDNSTHGFTDEDWEDLFYYIKDQNTTPFLGAGIAREHFGSGKELSEKIANKFEYPFDDISNLSKVAQFPTIKKKEIPY